MEIKLTGWNAVIAIVVVLAFVGFRFETRSGALETQGVQKVKEWLVAESERAALPDMQKAINDPNSSRNQLADMAQKLQNENVEITSVTRHGTGTDPVVRVQVHYKNGGPPNAKPVRYLRMRYSSVTGWTVQYEVSKWSYYLAVLG